MAGMSLTLLTHCSHREQTQRKQPHEGYKIIERSWVTRSEQLGLTTTKMSVQ